MMPPTMSRLSLMPALRSRITNNDHRAAKAAAVANAKGVDYAYSNVKVVNSTAC